MTVSAIPKRSIEVPNVLEEICEGMVLAAPMVGLSHYAVRVALQDFIPAHQKHLWPTEMLNSRRIPSQSEGESPEVIFQDRERGLWPQVLGNEKKPLQESVRQLEGWGARAIDINMGCPVQKALRHNYGVALMGDADYAARVVAMATEVATVPVSVKLRAGLQKDPEFLLRFICGLRDAGASWITLHPRTADQQRRGSADWSQIRFVQEAARIPVIGNGDLQAVSDIHQMLSETQCRRVMVGRALLAKPWLLGFSAESAPSLSGEESAKVYCSFLKRVAEVSESSYELAVGLRKFGFLVFHSSVWLEFGHFLWSRCRHAQSWAQVHQELDTFFSQPQRILDRTDRRR
jgi:tRNA-dihydrouridine synthase